ncbi:hypothetical protein EIN_186660 [Entamoeba invadens IP1]|uniref:hypothetical protein n=1 Tax=Entamoeba invadens IP1 TaxID=370355 RepID=UPI0002C3D836|nr:hypothetical protein EIN_186660 [Entamoeba invadens IP1]ELP94239.1 hypothetical protein EIN_186660 [Entamoeba invadens IP1]|eukprot:XP_004261010.1 hypothetical protein EIN_186660 [Entamoeba invadens IP1]
MDTNGRPQTSLSSTRRSVIGNVVFETVASSNMTGMRAYIEGGGDIKVTSPTGVNLFMFACGSGNYPMAKMLLNTNKVNVLDRDHKNRNCLHHLLMGRKESVDIFRMMQPRLLTQTRDIDGKLPLEYALHLKLPLMVKLILDIDNFEDVKLCYDYDNTPQIQMPSTANRYGFVNQQENSFFEVPNLTSQQMKTNTERIKKWKHMLSSLGKGLVPDKLYPRVYKGLPDEVRRDVWRIVLFPAIDMGDLKKEFESLNKSPKNGIDKQLHLDVIRTFQQHYNFKESFAGGQKMLFQIFHAIATKEKQFEFTQGMTCAPSMLTLFLDSVESYGGTLQLMGKKYRLKEMFSDFKLVNSCWLVTKQTIEMRHPKLYKKFKDLGFDFSRLPFFIFEWHYLWFIHALPFDFALKLFDVILLDGFYALFNIGDTIFHYLEKYDFTAVNENDLQQKLKTPLSLMKKQPTIEKFLRYMYRHRSKWNELNVKV